MDNKEEITEEQAATILRQFSEGRQSLHSFFTGVVKTKDTTKTGNLSVEELGMPKIPVRTMKELSLFSEKILNQKEWSNYFDKLSELQTSSSLSKEGFLMRLAVTSKKELADVTPSKKKNKGWFKSSKAPIGESQIL